MGAAQGFFDAAGYLDVIVLDEDGIVKTKAVVGTTANFDRVFVKQAQAWCSLARVDEFCSERCGNGCEFMGAGGNSG